MYTDLILGWVHMFEGMFSDIVVKCLTIHYSHVDVFAYVQYH